MYPLEDLPEDQQSVLFEQDENGREIRIFKLQDAQVADSVYYPGVQLFCHEDQKTYQATRERVMSFSSLVYKTRNTWTQRVEHRPMFFFVYNVDNYYHFVYDTLPYLITYKHLKKTIPNLKLLINFANDQQRYFNRFVLEFLELCGVNEDDLEFIEDQTFYKTIYISSSYTHDRDSNQPPRKEVYSLYKELAEQVEDQDDLPKKIYISRRSYKHGNYDNIGTNYTTRRSLTNESELVNFLESQGYVEIFTELLTTREKIALFKNCTHVVGPIGGGLCNVLFSSPSTKLISIVSPCFLDINGRFCYSFSLVDVQYFEDTEHVESTEYKKYMRVKVKESDITGEIHDIDGDTLTVIYSTNSVAGWNAQTQYKFLTVLSDGVEAIDHGLNSTWRMDLKKFQELKYV